MSAVVVRAVLHADQCRFGTAELAPFPGAREQRALAADVPEEVVRGEEDQVAAEIAIALDEVHLLRRHVFGMAAEDDQVVQPRQRVAAFEHLEIGLRQVVRLLAVLCEPAQKAEVVLPVLRRDASAEEGATETHGALRTLGVPGVTPAVAVLSRKLYACHVFVGMITATLVEPSCAGLTTNGAKPTRPSSAVSFAKYTPDGHAPTGTENVAGRSRLDHATGTGSVTGTPFISVSL